MSSRSGEPASQYERRFSSRDADAKDRVWTEVVRYLQRYVDADHPVLDIGCDRGYFIRHVHASARWATDIRDMSDALPEEVTFIQSDGLRLLDRLPEGSFGTVFMSNYLEHLPDRNAVGEQLVVATRLLRPRGRLIVLQPNIRHTGAAYWDFLDHHVALTDRSLVEAGELAGLRTVKLVSRFLPYTTKGRLPVSGAATRLYLRVPLAWRIFGAQTLYVAAKRGD